MVAGKLAVLVYPAATKAERMRGVQFAAFPAHSIWSWPVGELLVVATLTPPAPAAPAPRLVAPRAP